MAAAAVNFIDLRKVKHASFERWNCDSDEDRALASEEWQPPKSFGVLFFAVGSEVEREVRHSISCLHEAFGELDVTVVHGDIDCDFLQIGGTHDQNLCWMELMKLKLLAARLFPYDLTLLLDTDVMANPQHNSSSPVRALLDRFRSGRTDVIATNGPVNPVDEDVQLPMGHINGGMIGYRKSRTVDRFFACTATYMDAQRPTFTNEQVAYNRLLAGVPGMPMRSLQLLVLRDAWQCRFSKIPLYDCIFIHRHVNLTNVQGCPFSFKNKPMRRPPSIH